MRMPGGDRAVVELVKLGDYCLSAEHPRGRHKARVFRSTLGFTTEHAEYLRLLLLAASRELDASLGERDRHGQRYTIDLTVSGPAGVATVRSLWIVRTHEDFPRLTSCFVL
jgi:hypothetical protein